MARSRPYFCTPQISRRKSVALLPKTRMIDQLMVLTRKLQECTEPENDLADLTRNPAAGVTIKRVGCQRRLLIQACLKCTVSKTTEREKKGVIVLCSTSKPIRSIHGPKVQPLVLQTILRAPQHARAHKQSAIN
jgi:hypothetical protein